jgi:hypothetical protein
MAEEKKADASTSAQRESPREGGSYVRRNGKLQLVENTKPYEPKRPGEATPASPPSPASSPGDKE